MAGKRSVVRPLTAGPARRRKALRHLSGHACEERGRTPVVGRTASKRRIGTRIEPDLGIRGRDRPDAFVAAVKHDRARRSRGSATAFAYAFQSTMYGQRPGRNTVSLKSSSHHERARHDRARRKRG